MLMDPFIESMYPELSRENFIIPKDSINILNDISRVMSNYALFIETKLIDVLECKKIYSAYTDRDYHNQIKEINYR